MFVVVLRGQIAASEVTRAQTEPVDRREQSQSEFLIDVFLEEPFLEFLENSVAKKDHNNRR